MKKILYTIFVLMLLASCREDGGSAEITIINNAPRDAINIFVSLESDASTWRLAMIKPSKSKTITIDWPEGKEDKWTFSYTFDEEEIHYWGEHTNIYKTISDGDKVTVHIYGKNSDF